MPSFRVRVQDRARGLARTLWHALRPEASERELDEETLFHVDMETERLVRDGVPRAEARRRAFVAFGGVERHQQLVREARWTWPMTEAARDVRHALRGLLRRPLFTLATSGTIAVAIGASATFFSVLEAVLLRPLPVHDPDGLVGVRVMTRSGDLTSVVSLPDFRDYRTEAAGTVDLAAQHLSDVTLSSEGGGAQATLGLDVSSNYFQVLGLRPALGRFFEGVGADASDASAEVVLGHDLWEARYGGDPVVIGRTLRVNGHDLTIVGVAPDGFRGTLLGVDAAAFLPLGLQARLQGREIENRTSMSWLQLLGRLTPGTSADGASVTLGGLAKRLADAYDYPEQVEPDEVVIESLSPLPPSARDATARATGILLAASLVLLLIAVVNVAGMLVARATERGREIAVRLAMGAGRARVVWQLLAEGSMLGVLASFGGVALALLGTRLIEGVEPPGAPGFYIDLRIGGPVLAFTLATAFGATLMFGLVPSFHATRSDVAYTLRRGAPRGGASRGRSLLVGGQVALTLVLLASTALLLRTLHNAVSVDHGFDPDGLMIAEMNLRLAGYDDAESRSFYESLLARLRGSPEVVAAALSTSYPLGLGWDQTRASIPGVEAPEPSGWPVGWSAVSDGYFETLGLPLRAGEETDPRTPPLRIVVNATLAETLWGGEPAVGRPLRFGGRDAEVVGVAPAGRYRTLSEEPRLFAWVPLDYAFTPALYVHLRPRGAGADAIVALRDAVASLDPHVPLIAVGTLDAAMQQSMFFQRAVAGLIGVFAGLALLLSTTGIFGLLAYMVERRRREIGIRMAVGADAREVVRSVVGRGLRPVALGVAVGLVGALLAAGAFESLLYDVAPRDPLSLAAASLLLSGAALVAAWLPARRATQVDPASTLKAD